MTKKTLILTCLTLCALPLALYWNVQYFDFINYDDFSYVKDCRQVAEGMTWSSFVWMLADIHTGYWHPLTWLSHMLDWQLFRTHAGGHHWSSVILHLCNTLLVFAVFYALTKETGKSAFVAALFALHPLNVESVAWVAERKTLLSTFWGLLAMYLYVLYTQRNTWYGYVLVLFSFVLGLMAKPMLVTLPFVLLLLDWWPLTRLSCGGANTPGQDASGAGKASIVRPLIEKVPLLALSLCVSVATFLAVRHETTIVPLDVLPLGMRLENAVVSYVAYIGKMVWPVNLAVFYPYPASFPLWRVGLCVLLLAAITVAAIRLARECPYLLMGWLWYLGTLVPVIGIVQAGDQAMADRYAYIPLIGLFVMIAWGIPDLAARWPLRRRKEALALIALVALMGTAAVAWHQVQYWRNSISLLQHAINVTEANHVAHNNLGVAMMEQGRLEEAMAHFRKVLELNPGYVWAHNNIGVILLYQGKPAAAAVHFQQALEIKPRYAEAQSNLGIALARQGRLAEAAAHFQEALRINPSFDNARFNLENLQRRSREAPASGGNAKHG